MFLLGVVFVGLCVVNESVAGCVRVSGCGCGSVLERVWWFRVNFL